MFSAKPLFLASVASTTVAKLAEKFASMTLSEWAAVVGILAGAASFAVSVRDFFKPKTA